MKRPIQPCCRTMSQSGFKIRCDRCSRKFSELNVYKDKQLCDECHQVIARADMDSEEKEAGMWIEGVDGIHIHANIKLTCDYKPKEGKMKCDCEGWTKQMRNFVSPCEITSRDQFWTHCPWCGKALREELKPCPFCGSKKPPGILLSICGAAQHQCSTCKACGPAIENFSSTEKLTAAWNRRAGGGA
jgi:Lar family restriction alleviation protein